MRGLVAMRSSGGPVRHTLTVNPPDPAAFERARYEFGHALVALYETAIKAAEKLHALYTLFPPRPDPSWTNEQINTWLFRERP